MVFRQTNDFGASRPETVDDILGAYATLHGLAREGRTGKKGMPETRCNSLRLDARTRSTGVLTSACQSHFKWFSPLPSARSQKHWGIGRSTIATFPE